MIQAPLRLPSTEPGIPARSTRGDRVSTTGPGWLSNNWIAWVLVGLIALMVRAGQPDRLPSLLSAPPIDRQGSHSLPEDANEGSPSEEGSPSGEDGVTAISRTPSLRPPRLMSHRRPAPTSSGAPPGPSAPRPAGRGKSRGHFLAAGRTLRHWLRSQTC